MLWLSGKADGHAEGGLAAHDGAVIPYREWRRPGAKAAILYLHGQGDHSGPFTAMGDQLESLGFNVYAYDHRGFGLSREPRGDIPSFVCYMNDALAMIRHVRQRNPGLPIFLVGLSMGGHIALRTACRAGDEISGVIALSPGFKLRRDPPLPFVVKGFFLGLFQPTRYMPTLISDVITTRNTTHVARAGEDEYWVTSYTARFYLGMAWSIMQAKRELRRLKVPALVLQAGEDYLVCAEESRRFFERIGHPDREFRLLEGLCHNLVVEPEMPEIARQIGQWIDRRIQPA